MNILYSVDWTPIIASIALAFSVFSFFRYEVKIQKLTTKVMSQQETLSELALQEHEEKKQQQKTANLRISVRKGQQGQDTIVISNSGPASAEQISFKIIAPSDSYNVQEDLSRTFSLNPDQKHEVHITMFNESPDVLDVTLTWSDESSQDRSLAQVLQF